jgi:hypothetical protein
MRSTTLLSFGLRKGEKDGTHCDDGVMGQGKGEEGYLVVADGDGWVEHVADLAKRGVAKLVVLLAITMPFGQVDFSKHEWLNNLLAPASTHALQTID